MHVVRLFTAAERILLAAALGLALAAAFSVLAAVPAGACRCSAPSDDAAFDMADAVFTGELVDIVRSTQVARFAFEVDEVFKGAVTQKQTIVTQAHGASCGLEISGPGPYVVIGFRESTMTTGASDGELYSHLCSGTRPLADRQWTNGSPGRPPTTAEGVVPTTTSTESAAEAAAPEVADEDGGMRPWWLAAGVGGLVLAAVGLWLFRRPA